ncbi:MAG: hypothetical protein LBQ66_16510 [Planctomycetaceae bacterium]|jgi:hypothetical protein|nr:hypothetical protein [Planctomycetaceae bacterium]
MKDRTAWHPAFYKAYQLEFDKFRDKLTFISEHQLTKEPSRIDLIVKKQRGAKIEKNIGRIFREYNVVEYKSPNARFSEQDFNRARSYVFLYASIEKIHVTDMSLTIATYHYPRELMHYLENEERCTLTVEEEGIIVVGNNICPMQIILLHKLPEKDNIWVKSLHDNLTLEELSRFLEELAKLGERPETDALVDVITNKNYEIFKEIIMVKKFEEMLVELGCYDRWYNKYILKEKDQIHAMLEKEVREELNAKLKEKIEEELKAKLKKEIEEKLKAELKKEIVKEEFKARDRATQVKVVEMIKNMKKHSIADKEIAEIVGLPLERVKKVK